MNTVRGWSRELAGVMVAMVKGTNRHSGREGGNEACEYLKKADFNRRN